MMDAVSTCNLFTHILPTRFLHAYSSYTRLFTHILLTLYMHNPVLIVLVDASRRLGGSREMGGGAGGRGGQRRR